jgi:hypothetical protein
MEWSAIESAYAIKPDERKRDQVLTEQSVNDSSATFVADMIKDITTVFTQSKSPNDFFSSLFVVLMKGDRALIMGTLLVIVSLVLLCLENRKVIIRDKVEEQI